MFTRLLENRATLMIRLIGVKIELGSTLRRPATIAALLRLLKMMHLAVRIREIKGVALKSGNLTVHPARGLANCASNSILIWSLPALNFPVSGSFGSPILHVPSARNS